MDEERRRTIRRKTLKGATIVFNNATSTLTCVVRNMSESGARLEVESSVGVPTAFTLELRDGRAFECAVVWRGEKAIGVTFGRIANG